LLEDAIYSGIQQQQADLTGTFGEMY
jgi:hypothetical protein